VYVVCATTYIYLVFQVSTIIGSARCSVHELVSANVGIEIYIDRRFSRLPRWKDCIFLTFFIEYSHTSSGLSLLLEYTKIRWRQVTWNSRTRRWPANQTITVVSRELLHRPILSSIQHPPKVGRFLFFCGGIFGYIFSFFLSVLSVLFRSIDIQLEYPWMCEPSQ